MSVLDRLRDDDTLLRRNGELVFEEPWHSRAFSVAVALAETGRCDWEEFRGRLVAEIGGRDEDQVWEYYAHWLAALERLLIDQGVTTADELDRRTADAAHAAAHEHDHDHHDHGGRPHA